MSRNGNRQSTDDSGLSLDAHPKELLRRSLRSSIDSLPVPPPELTVSLQRAIRQKTTPGNFQATGSLIRAEWPVVLRERLIPAIAFGLVLVFWTAGGLLNDFDLLILAGALPVAAGLFTLLLSGPWADRV